MAVDIFIKIGDIKGESMDKAHKDEIDVLKFNQGGTSRPVVAHAIDMFLECVFPGIPVAARPPVMIGTHVHTGRLELNIIIPKAVLQF